MTTNPTAPDARPPGLPPIDINEYGGKKDGERQCQNRRLFMQLLVMDVAPGTAAAPTADAIARMLQSQRIPGVIYADVNQPRGIGLLTWSEDPAHFVRAVRPLFAAEALAAATLRPSFTMFGRSYSTGHEPDLEFTLLRRPIENSLNEAYPWHVWYPLRRTGPFNRLPPEETGPILREHAQIGMAYGQLDLAHDIRLACHGMDANDNEFVVGLVGKDLHPLSHLVQTMRKTRQTSEYIASMGPFFVGLALHRIA